MENRKSSNPTVLTSYQYASELREELLCHASKHAIIKRIGCYDYEVLERNSKSKNVKILCRFLKDSDVKEFEKSFYGDRFAKTLEQFFLSKQFQQKLGISKKQQKNAFKLEVSIDRKQFTKIQGRAIVSHRYVSTIICKSILHLNLIDTSRFISIIYCIWLLTISLIFT